MNNEIEYIEIMIEEKPLCRGWLDYILVVCSRVDGCC